MYRREATTWEKNRMPVEINGYIADSALSEEEAMNMAREILQ